MAGSLLIYSRVMWFTIKSNDFPSSKFAKQYLMVDHQNHQNVDCKSVSKPLCSTSPTSYIHTQYMHIIYCYCKCWGTPPVILMIAINKLQLLTYIYIYLFIYVVFLFRSNNVFPIKSYYVNWEIDTEIWIRKVQRKHDKKTWPHGPKSTRNICDMCLAV